jgi:Sulfotransferase domain
MAIGPTRVLGCGLSRTGNTSLAEALRILGYRPIRYPLSIDCLEETYDAAVDITVVAWMDEIDHRFPEAKWVLTTRDENEWLLKMAAFLRRPMDRFPPGLVRFFMHIREQVYGSAEFQEETYSRAFRNHHERVRHRFGKCPGKLLTINFSHGDPWPDLCRFLGMPEPNVPFPHLNRMGESAL